ncbi:conserved hypothetical protein [Gloeothece citriformis PCC 7424]|uniref:Uncharacterized protein n=2 Tax=Gloeothece TaxID=28070 RepID=B7KGT2_GLOC7|nr:conserved hypothetical protein [Gloeothece citriformis PCC 7424]
MSQTPITVTYTLEQIITKLDQRLDKIEGKIDNLQKDVTQMNVRLAKVETKLEGVDNDVKELKTTQKNQIWSLIALSFTAVLGLIGAILKILFFPNS